MATGRTLDRRGCDLANIDGGLLRKRVLAMLAAARAGTA
jgi:hypothetical protein